MNTTLINAILNENRTFQQLRTTDGPAPLMVSFVAVKTLFSELRKAEPTNSTIIQSAELLQEQGWQDASNMLDHYVREEEDAYQMAFNRLQALVADAVNTLPSA